MSQLHKNTIDGCIMKNILTTINSESALLSSMQKNTIGEYLKWTVNSVQMTSMIEKANILLFRIKCCGVVLGVKNHIRLIMKSE